MLLSPKTLGMSLLGSPVNAMAALPKLVSLAHPPPACRVSDEARIETLASLQCMVDEGSVFGAVTAPKNSGKSAILNELLARSKNKNRVCIDIRTPHQVTLKTAEALTNSICKVVDKFSGQDVHILIVVDNAHTASRELLTLLNSLAGARSSFGSPQLVLAGEPELWDRLGSRYYDKLSRRIALRFSLDRRQSSSY